LESIALENHTLKDTSIAILGNEAIATLYLSFVTLLEEKLKPLLHTGFTLLSFSSKQNLRFRLCKDFRIYSGECNKKEIKSDRTLHNAPSTTQLSRLNIRYNAIAIATTP
jgi:hypothetical protein